jgi:hypothetical protein
MTEIISTGKRLINEMYKIREQNRKRKIIGNFKWKKCTFYYYAQQRNWVRIGKANLMKINNLRCLAKYLEEKTGIKQCRTNKRYKNGLVKYIDDNF